MAGCKVRRFEARCTGTPGLWLLDLGLTDWNFRCGFGFTVWNFGYSLMLAWKIRTSYAANETIKRCRQPRCTHGYLVANPTAAATHVCVVAMVVVAAVVTHSALVSTTSRTSAARRLAGENAQT